MADKGKIIIDPETDALIVVDMTKTFMEGGGLAVKGGRALVAIILSILTFFARKLRIATKDRHPWGHITFASSYIGIASYARFSVPGQCPWLVRNEQGLLVGVTVEVHEGDAVRTTTITRDHLAPHAKFNLDDLADYLGKVGSMILWPDHGIAGTDEAELHPDLLESLFGYILVKGLDPTRDSNGAFFDNAGRPTELADVLRARGVKRVFVCGLAFDFCVAYTAEGAALCGFEVYVIGDATEAVRLPGSVETTIKMFERRNIKTIVASQLKLAA